MRLTCSDELRLFYLTTTVWTCPETGQAGEFIFPAAYLRGHANCRKWIRQRKSSPCDSSYQRIHLCDTTLSVSTRHFENNFGQSACFQHFARTISDARLSEQPIGRHAVSLTGCSAIQKGRIGRRVEMIAFILSCDLHCQRPAAFLYPELSKTLQGRVKNQLAISALTYAHYSILKAHRGDDCDFPTAKAATPRRGVAAF